MNFFGIGSLELVLILIVVLLIFGPAKVPEIARSLGRMVHDLKKATLDLTAEVTKEIEGEDDHPPGKGEKRSSKTDKSAGL